ncbi:MAG: hypothetical protein ACRDZR_07160 [Acidimicrobiales bacterium]
MPSPASHHTVRTVADHVRHVLFPSRRQVVITMTVDIAAMMLGVPFPAHVVVDVVIHVAFRVIRR